MIKLSLGVFLAGCLLRVAAAQDFIGEKIPFTKDRLRGTQESSASLGAPSFLDPSRFSMRQSYSMSYTSMGGEGDLTGLYLNRLQYQFQAPVTLQVDLGLFHKPMMLSQPGPAGPDGPSSSVFTVPRVGLTYQPSKNLFMSFEYFHMPQGYGSAHAPYAFPSAFPTLPPLDGAVPAPSK